MEAFLVSTMVVGLAEIGDKTQILSMILAARFHRPIPIIFGIFFATIANHAAAGLAGTLVGDFLRGEWMRWILGISFLSVAVWALFPDKYEEAEQAISRWGAFMSTVIAFFFAEIGDKTQIATVGLAARFEQFLPVVAGTTLGMMLANIPAVVLGNRLAGKLPVTAIRLSRITKIVGFADMGSHIDDDTSDVFVGGYIEHLLALSLGTQHACCPQKTKVMADQRIVAAIVFAVLGVLTLIGVGK